MHAGSGPPENGAVQNPWLDLPLEPEFVLEEDDSVLKRYPHEREKLSFAILPVPFFGNPTTAKVVLLTLNPAIGPDGVRCQFPPSSLDSSCCEQRSTVEPSSSSCAA